MNQTIKIDKTEHGFVVDATVAWMYAEDPQSKRIIAVCPSLNITLEVDKQDELWPEIDRGMNSFFTSALKHGVLESFLKTRNWMPPSATVPMHAIVTAKKVTVEKVEIDDLALAATC